MAGTAEEVLIPRGRLKWKKAALSVFVSALVLAVVFKLSRDDRILRGIRSTPGGLWAACIPTFMCLHVLSALKWRFCLRTCGGGIPVAEALRCHGAGLFANLCLPSLVGGDVLRAALAHRFVPSVHVVIVAALLDRLADVFGLCLLSAGGWVASPEARSLVAGAGWVGLAVPACIVAALIVSLLIVKLAARRPLRRWPRKVGKKLVGMLRTMRLLRRHWLRAAFGVILATAIQSLFVLVNWRLGSAMGFDMAPHLWFLLWPLAKIAAMAPFSFGGIGVREAAFAVLVAPFADRNLAVAESLVWQSVLVVGGLICGALFVMTRRRHRAGS